jgi:hypothetical protein
MFDISSPAWYSFHPLGDVIHSDQDVLIVMGFGKVPM